MALKPLYVALASAVIAYQNCVKSGNREWEDRHKDRILQLARENLPSGSGLDNGCSISVEQSSDARIVIATSFHHMDGESGGYDGWTEHEIVVKPSLAFGISLRITGRNRNEIKDYLGEMFQDYLTRQVEEYPS